jgi:hypothetical protein
LDEGLKSLSFREFHDNEWAVTILPEVKKTDDIRGVKSGEGVALFEKFVDGFLRWTCVITIEKPLNRHLTSQLVIVALHRPLQRQAFGVSCIVLESLLTGVATASLAFIDN